MSDPTMLEIVQKTARNRHFGYGIGIAAGHVEALRKCLGNDSCSKLFTGLSDDEFNTAMKSASEMLVYAEEECWEKGGKFTATSVNTMKSILDEVVDGPKELPKHAAMVFRNFVTTDQEDRDRDVLDPMGAIVDKSMPLLWQHLQPQPIGRLLGTIEQTGRFLKVASCICDINELARDSIKMVESGILRISHGFKPKQFDMRPGTPGSQMPSGFHVKSYEVVEESLVSVPANSGAIIDAWASLISRKEVKSAPVIRLGASYWGLRDTANQFASAEVPKTACSCNKTTETVDKNSGSFLGPAADTTGSSNPGIGAGNFVNAADSTEDEGEETDELEGIQRTADTNLNAGDYTIDSEKDVGEKGYSKEQRVKLAKDGKALPDGSYPIVNAHDLKRAIKAYGRASDPVAAKDHIIKRAKAIGCDDLIPADWKTTEKSTDNSTKADDSVGDNLVCPKCNSGEVRYPRSDPSKKTCSKCKHSWTQKDVDAELKSVHVVSKIYTQIQGSYEWITETLSGQLKAFLQKKPSVIPANTGMVDDNGISDSDYFYTNIEATMSDRIIVSISASGTKKFYSIPYAIGDDGIPKLTVVGGIKEVNIAGTVLAGAGKHLADASILEIERAIALKMFSVSCDDVDSINSLKSIAKLTTVSSNNLRSEFQAKSFELSLLGAK